MEKKTYIHLKKKKFQKVREKAIVTQTAIIKTFEIEARINKPIQNSILNYF